MVFPIPAKGIVKALFELEAKRIVKFSCAGVPIVYYDGGFFEAELFNYFCIKTEQKLPNAASAACCLNSEKGRVWKPPYYRVRGF